MIVEEQKEIMESLLDRARDYWKSSIELIKLKALDKASAVVAAVVSKIVTVAAFTVFFLFVNLGLALWLGDMLGKIYYGLFCVAGFYLILWLLLIAFKTGIRKKIGDAVVNNMMNEDE